MRNVVEVLLYISHLVLSRRWTRAILILFPFIPTKQQLPVKISRPGYAYGKSVALYEGVWGICEHDLIKDIYVFANFDHSYQSTTLALLLLVYTYL